VTHYEHPSTLQAALELLDSGGGSARVIAGGTDLLPDIKKGTVAPAQLIDVTRIPELRKIRIGRDRISVGAAVPFVDIKNHPHIQAVYPALSEAAGSIGAGAIQRAATWGGNLVQAMPAADGAVIALALEAEAELADREKTRRVPVEELFLGPGISAVDPTREILTAVHFPAFPDQPGWGLAWQRIGRRQALVLPILNCAVKLQLDFNPELPEVRKAVIGLGPAAPHPLRAREAEEYLQGRPFSPDTIREAGLRVQAEAQPRSSLMRASREYRLEIIPEMIGRALQEAAAQARANPPRHNPEKSSTKE
jgi:carbon-monoxide dehydrogenase medium subunit